MIPKAPDLIPHKVDEVESDRDFRRMLSRLSASRQDADKTRGQPRRTKLPLLPSFYDSPMACHRPAASSRRSKLTGSCGFSRIA